MPLIKIQKKEQEAPYIFTAYEKELLKLIPEEQIKAANHNPDLLDLMLADEDRDASPEHTLRDIYSSLQLRDQKRLLAATKNLTVQERNKIVQGIYNHALSKKADMTPEDAKRIALLNEEPLDLFDLCIRLSI